MTATIPALLQPLKDRLAAATPGPWEVVPEFDTYMIDGPDDECTYCQAGDKPVKVEEYEEFETSPAYTVHYHAGEAHHINAVGVGITGNYDYEVGGILDGKNTEFIAHAPTDQAKLIAAIEAVGSIHFEAVAYADDIAEGGDVEIPEDYERHYCEEDGEDWPCRTVAALTQALEGEVQ